MLNPSVDKIQILYAIECYQLFKKEEIMPFVTKGMNPGSLNYKTVSKYLFFLIG